MSYDLFFRPRSPSAPPIALGQFHGWFGTRAFFRFEGDGGRQAWYENEDTGVYFSFRHRDPGDVSFNINYCRPHTFGLEAEEELDAFVREYDLLVSDPQSEGMGDGEYSSEGFLRGWNAGNRLAMTAIPGDMATMPAQTLEAIWRWNRARNLYQEHFAEIAVLPCFVPKIVALEGAQGGARSAIVWGQGIGIVIPEVDGALVVPSERKDGLRWVPMDEITRILGPRPVQPAGHSFEHFDGEHFEVPLPARVLAWDQPPQGLVAALDAAGEPFRQKGLPWAHVLDAELRTTS